MTRFGRRGISSSCRQRGARRIAICGVELMDFFEWNKIAGAVLGTVLFILVVQIAAEALAGEDFLHQAPRNMPVTRVDEAKAVKNPQLRYRSEE
ncbi:MAG: hypothetical protein IID54_00155 [Proteobacteria bacterium]|nr:hypothetical protein [Pseudomonadota bacterium]